jgi:Rps23 Pro-64 3,4-dihydroxylase Tpa1-like proline 4-hydroxylase
MRGLHCSRAHFFAGSLCGRGGARRSAAGDAKCALNVTWFDTGDFLEQHTGDPNGNIAFTWCLTKNWQYNYGGNLHLLPAGSGIEQIEIPAFNRFLLFPVAGSRTPHFVSRVNANVAARRLAVSGWYRQSA